MSDLHRAEHLAALVATHRAGVPSIGDFLQAFAEVRAEERARTHASMLSFAGQLVSFADELNAAGHGKSDARVALMAAAKKVRRAAIGYTLTGGNCDGTE